VQRRLVAALIVSQILLLGLLSTQEAEKSTVALLPLPVLTIWFHYVCKGRFEPAFIKFPLQVGLTPIPHAHVHHKCHILSYNNLDVYTYCLVLQEAMVKDTLERANDPTLNLREYLKDAYVHPVFQKNDMYELVAMDEEEKNPLVATRRQARMNTPVDSKFNSSSGTNEGEFSRMRPA
jgi:hypothetical protein